MDPANYQTYGPEIIQQSQVDIEDIPKPFKELNAQEIEILEDIVHDFIQAKVSTKRQFYTFRTQVQRKYRIGFNNAQLLFVYRTMLSSGQLTESCDEFESLVKSQTVRGTSGVTVFTLLTSPFPETGEFVDLPEDLTQVDYREINPETGEKRQNFSCPYNCYYCPDESRANGAQDDMPRSYLKHEPAVARAFRNNFDTVNQIRDRAKAYIVNGIDVDKIEVIIEGGTYTSYPKAYRMRLMRNIFYGFNTLFDQDFTQKPRHRRSLEDEILINESAQTRVIGITVETRPDCITPECLREFRECGVTRVQIGVQHTDNKILKKINRQCTTEQAITAIRMMKDCGFKIDIHLMPDLPNSSYEKDCAMFTRINTDPDLDIDQLKIYPTATVPWTVIQKWYKEGKYQPYAESMREMEIERVVVNPISGESEIVRETRMTNPLVEAIIHYKRTMPKRRRNNRIQRDIPSTYIQAGSNRSNLRQLIQEELHRRGFTCPCIRCREVRGRETDISQATLFVEEFTASKGREFFLSYATPDEKILFGFLRLRFTDDPGFSGTFPELHGCGLIRELHVYGKMQSVGAAAKIQHCGLGSKLLQKAEEIARDLGWSKLAVISGVGVRDYYRQRGYLDEGHFFVKNTLF